MLLFLFGLTVFSIYEELLLKGRPTFWPDTYEYAQVGRNTAQGAGFAANSVTTKELWTFRDRAGVPPVPYFFHDPGQSLLLAVSFWIYGEGDGDRAIAWTTGLFFALLVPLAFLLGVKVFGSRRTALLGAALVGLNTQLLACSATGLTEVPLAFFITLALYCLYEARPRWRLALAGVVCGALVVLRSNSLPFLPSIAVYLSLADREPGVPRLRNAASRLVPFVLGLFVVLGPNALRNYATLGSPFKTIVTGQLLLLHTSAIPGKSRDIFSQPGFSVDPIEFFSQHPEELVLKVWTQLRDAVVLLLNGGLAGGGNWADCVLIFLFFLAMLGPPPDETASQRALRWLVAALILTTFFVGAVVHLRWRYVYGFFPVVLLYDAELLSRMLPLRPIYAGAHGRGGLVGQWPAAAVVILLVALGAQRVRVEVDSTAAVDARERDNYYRALGEFVRANTRKGATILVRNADPVELWALGWYGGRRQVVEFSDFSLSLLTSKKNPGPLFVLATSGHGEVRSTGVDIPGFEPTMEWHAGSGDYASLYRWQQPTRAGL